jgi:hypothetical protein
LNFKGSEHLVFSDAVWLANGAIKTGAAGMPQTVAAIRTRIAAFLDVNLEGKPVDRLLAGSTSDDPNVEVTQPNSNTLWRDTGRFEKATLNGRHVPPQPRSNECGTQ